MINKKTLFVVFLCLLFFSSSALAEFRLSTNTEYKNKVLNEDNYFENFGVKAEYIFDNNVSAYINPRISTNPVIIQKGTRYYTDRSQGFFSDVSLITRNEELRFYNDLQVKGGYITSFDNLFTLDLTAGYTITSDEDDYYSVQIGLNFSLSNFFAEQREDKTSKKETELNNLREKYSDWEENIIKSILDEEINREMTTEQVEASWGEPVRIQKESGGDYQDWTYEKFDNLNNQYIRYTLFFVDDELNHWEIEEDTID